MKALSIAASATVQDVGTLDPRPRRLDRLSEMALSAATLAWRHYAREVAPERRAAFFSTDHGNFSGTTAFLERLHDKGARLASPIDFPNLVLSAPIGALSQHLQLRGELLTFNDAGMHALWSAHECLVSRRADCALVVSAEEHSAARTRRMELLGVAPDRLNEGAAAIVLEDAPGSVQLASIVLGSRRAAEECLRLADRQRAAVVWAPHARHVELAALADRAEDPAMQSLVGDVASAAARIAAGEASSVLLVDGAGAALLVRA